MGYEKKLKQYIRDDRPKKLKSYVESRNVDVVTVHLSGGRSLLHYCAQHGSTDMLRCLIRLDLTADKQDHNGNLPLHLAALRCLEQDQETAKDTFDEIIVPLLNAYSLGQDVENKSGETGFDLVKAVKEKLKSRNKETQNGHCFQDKVTEEEDEMWRRKLSEEAMFEHQEQVPQYQHLDDYRQEEESETYESWSERIGHEISAKRQSQSHRFARDKKKKNRNSTNHSKDTDEKKSKEEEEQERLNQAREEMKKRYKPLTASFLQKKQRYEKKFSHLLTHLTGQTLTFGCIPWPNPNLDLVASTLFCDLPDKTSSVYRKYLKTQQVRWHPDKFTQRFRDHLHTDHVHKIMNRVKHISQLLNKLSDL